MRTLYQRCPHLGCKPNFCTINYWFECPCHGSRYDRLGTKVQELGPAPRSLDRFAHKVENGVLTVDTSKITLGPLPVALGQPGLIPAKAPGAAYERRAHRARADAARREPAICSGTDPGAESSVERFSAGARTHAVGLTEERAAQIVRQSGNARNVAFLAVLLIALFIPVYWFYDLGVPALGISGQMAATANEQYVTDVERGYALFLANCARCHGDNGQGGVGPPLNDQAKLYNAINQNGGSGTGHLNPNYITQVLTVGGRYVCGDANSVMPAWLQPNGPLNYREVEELMTFITASTDVTFTYDPHSGHAVGVDPKATPYTVTGWRDPNYEPPPGAPTPPACWRNPSGQIGGSSTAANASLAPIANPGHGGRAAGHQAR